MSDPQPAPYKISRIPTAGTAPEPLIVQISDVEPTQTSWLWKDRIPFGKITILDGDPGLGKSLVTLDLAARLSTGRPMPEEAPCDLDAAADVMLLNCEDELSDTIRPRLDAAKADAERIHVFTAIKWPGGDALPSLSDDLQIDQALQETKARLLIVDPLMAYLPGNSHRDQDVRQVLAPLAALASSRQVAVFVVRHLNKSYGGSPIYRGGGSIGIIGAARSALLVAKDPDDRDRRILAVSKANLSAPATALAYRVVEHGSVARIEWDGRTDHDADQLLRPESPERLLAIEEAMEFLEAELEAGPLPSERVLEKGKQAGHSSATLRRARARLGIKSKKVGKPGEKQYWKWMPPEGDLDQSKVITSAEWSSSGPGDHLRLPGAEGSGGDE